ncbi:MAG: TonB-dependent receptor [Chitinophagaceae bacterium]
MKKITKLAALVTMVVASQASFAQAKTGKISGNVGNGQKKLDAATVSLLKANDSSLVKMAITDKSGHFEVENLADGKYLVLVTSVAYENAYSQPFELTTQKHIVELPAFVLSEAGKALKNVTVTVKKPFVEQKLDRTIVNVDAMASNTGLTVLDVLEKSPGISVDKDGNISLKGKQGVMILMDGKPTYLGGQDLVNLLKSMPSNQLELLEIMTNPPAKFDAAGNSGIINLKTKKNKARGYNGSVSLGYGQGVYAKTNSSVNLNYRNGKWNLFGNYGYNFSKNFQDILLTRNFKDKNTLDLLSVFEQNAMQLRQNTFQSYKAGADFYINNKTTLGFVYNGFTNPGTEYNNNTTNIFDNKNVLETKNTGLNIIERKMNNNSVNLNLRHQFDSTGTELTSDLDYVGYHTANNQQFNNYFFDKNGFKKQPDELLKSNLPQDIKIFSAKADFTKQLSKSTRFEAGAKASFVKTDNNALYQNWLNNTWQTDLGRTNHFIYTENINAAYVSMSKEFSKKWSAQFGLRLENTNSKGNQVTNGTRFDRNYTQLFPTTYIGYNANGKNQFVLSYGRRIQRPDYEDLNPFYNFLDKYTYQVGNPYLSPQFTHGFELRHTFAGVLTTSLNFSTTKDIITEIIDQVDSTNTTFVRKSNVSSQENFGLSINIGLPVTKWWRPNFYANLHHDKYSGVINAAYTSVNATSLDLNLGNQFTFRKGWGADMGGFFQTGGIRGVLAYKAQGGLSIGFSKQLLKNNMGTFKIGIRDPFYFQKFHGYSKYQNIDIDFRSARDSRVVNLGFTYRFGKPIKGLKQRKSGGAGEEQNRVGGGGN